MADDQTRFDSLLDYLATLPQGIIADTRAIESLLSACWHELDTERDDGGMEGYKLHERMENADWRPPILTFVIERHGGTALGSTRAELQEWRIDVETRTGHWRASGYRQISARQPALDVTPLAEEIVRLFDSPVADKRLKQYEDGSVKVLIGKILLKCSAVKRTLEGRRQRFRTALKKLILAKGWEEVTKFVFRRKISE